MMADSDFSIEEDEKGVRLRGPLDLAHFAEAKKALDRISLTGGVLDLSEVSRMDTAGALLLIGLQGAEFSGVKQEHRALLELVNKAKPESSPPEKKLPPLRHAIIASGKHVSDLMQSARDFIRFMGHACIAFLKALLHPGRLRMGDIAHHIEVIGIGAIPIISLIAIVISVVIAYQGQVQLKPLGAQHYTINLIAISVLREMGVLLTAIIVAGRSGSAFTAEIGTMKVREEVDALKTIGFDTFELLVLPRLIALVIALPLLAFIADMVGLFGGGLITMPLLDISMLQYVEHARQAATGKDFLVGMIKAPVFAFIIALVGCRHGLKVSGSAESVGKETTASVVESIFLVLVLDGLFSVYFEKVGI